MKLADLVDRLGLQVRSGRKSLAAEVTGGYASDLLSDVIANSAEGNVWVTLQVHENIVAVASLKGHAAILLVNNREPHEETIEKAEAEKIPILVSGLPTFEVVGRLYDLGIRGSSAEGIGGKTP